MSMCERVCIRTYVRVCSRVFEGVRGCVGRCVVVVTNL